jgi:hypothetical protein
MNRLVPFSIGLLSLMTALSLSSVAEAEILAPPPDVADPDPNDPDVAPEPEYPADPPPPPPPPLTQPAPTPHDTATSTAATPATTHPPASADSASTEEEEEEEEDDREWFWIEASAGYSYINLLQIKDEGFTGEPDLLQGSGFIFEGGLGFEISILQIGVTSSYAQYEHFDILTAELDVTLVIPIPIIEPFIRVGAGYAHMGNVEVAMMGATPEKARIRGIGIDLGVGLDIHISDAFQLGFAFDASFLNLQRQKVTALGTISNVDFTQTGNAVGLQLNGTVRVTFQF